MVLKGHGLKGTADIIGSYNQYLKDVIIMIDQISTPFLSLTDENSVIKNSFFVVVEFQYIASNTDVRRTNYKLLIAIFRNFRITAICFIYLSVYLSISYFQFNDTSVYFFLRLKAIFLPPFIGFQQISCLVSRIYQNVTHKLIYIYFLDLIYYTEYLLKHEQRNKRMKIIMNKIYIYIITTLCRFLVGQSWLVPRLHKEGL